MRSTCLENGGKLWLRWVLANAFGELLGLGLTFAFTALLFLSLTPQMGVEGVLLFFVGAVVSGAIEATIVGLAQWWVMRPCFPALTRFEWWRATLVGALVAYGLGYLPSALMSLGQPASEAPATEPPQLVILLLSAGLGAVGGAVLAFAQGLVLRRHVTRAGRWVLANVLAWTAGMPLIFWGLDLAFRQPSLLRAGIFVVVVLLLTGALVGAIHGIFLVRLAGERCRE